VLVGRGALARLVSDLAGAGPSRVVIVSDSRVAALYGRPLAASFRKRRVRADLLSFRPGEASKTRATKARLEDRLLLLGADRDTVVVALGGGVTGDLAGFLAATWHRGVRVIHAPSSLLAMADSALGGKTGVDLAGAKNVVGAFHQPAAVYADTSLLSTLPAVEWAHGFAEMIKTAVVSDRGFFSWLEDAADPLRRRRPAAVEHAVVECLRLKGRVVARDERDLGRRAILNFGHTAAHAIEAASGFRIPHGRAVAIGLRAEGEVAAREGPFRARDQARLRALLEGLVGGPLRADVTRAGFLRAVRADKKNREGRVRCARPVRIGAMPAGPDPTTAVDPVVLFDAVTAAV
jgi:3-dehydroquinate synthase